MSSGRSSQLAACFSRGAHEVLDVVEVDALQVGAPVRHRLLVERPQRPQPDSRASTPARSSCPRCHAPPPRTARAARWRPRRRNPPSHSRTGPARRWPLPGSAARLGAEISGVRVMSTLLRGRGGFGAGCAPKGCWLVRVERNVRGAGAVAVDDGRQPLHMGARDLGEGLALGFAQLRELLGNVRYRAVVLADLDAVDRPAHRRGGGRVPGLGQRVRRRDRPSLQRQRGPSVTPDRMASMRRRANVRTASSPPISRSWRIAAPARSSYAWSSLARPAAVSRYRLAGRPRPLCCQAAAALALRVAGVDQGVQVPAHARRGDAEPLADLAGGDRALLQQQLDDGAAGVPIRSRHDARLMPAMRDLLAPSGRIFTTPL